MPEIANLVVKYSADTKDAEAGAGRVNSAIGTFGKTAALVGAAAGVAVGGFLLNGIRAAANFEQGMSGVAASLGGVGTAGGITEAQFKALNDEALRIGQTTSVGATDAALAMDLLAKAGVSTEDIINGTAQAVVNVSEATGESINQSASSLGSLSNLFAATGISGAEMADVIVNAMNSSDATLSEFQTGIANLAPVISGTGMEFDEAAGLVSFFNSQGMAAAKVGSSLTSAYMNLVNPTNDMAAAQQALGISVYDSQGAFVGFPAILDQVRTATEGMTDQQRDAWITQLFGAEALDVVTMALESQEGALEDHIGTMNESGAAATAAATRMDNLKGDLEGLRGAFETLSIKVGGAFTPALRTATQALTRFLTGAMDFVSELKLMYDTGNVFTEQWIKKFPGWAQPVVRAIVGMHEAFQDVIDAFQDLRRGDFAGFFAELREAATGFLSTLRDLGTVALNWVLDTGIPTITGWIVDHAGDVWNGIKSLAGWAWDGIADVGLWSLNVGVPSVVGAITGIAGRLGDWLRSYIYGGGIVGDGTGGPEPGPGGGIVVEIAQIALNVLDAIANIQSADVVAKIQEEINSLLVGVDFAVDGIKLVIGAITGENVSATGDIPGAIQTFIDNTKKEYRKTVDLLLTINTIFGGGGGGGGGGIPTPSNPFGGGGDGTGRVQEWVDAHFPDKVYKTISAIMNYELTNVPGDLVSLKNEIVEHLNGITILAADLVDMGASAAGATTGAIADGIKGMVGFAANIKGRLVQEFNEAVPTLQDLSGMGAKLASATKDAIVNGIKGMVGFAADIKARLIQELNEARPSAGDLGDWAASFGGAIKDAILGWLPGKISKEDILSILPFGSWGEKGKAATPRSGPDAATGRNDMSALGGSLTSLRAQVDAAVGAITVSLGRVGTTFQTTASLVNASTTQMAAMVRTQFTVMQAATTAAVTVLTTQVRAQFTAMQAAVMASMAQMQAQSMAAWAAITAQGVASVNQLRGAVQSGMQAMAAAGQSAMAQFASAVQSGFQQAAAAAQAGVAAIRGAVNSIGSLYGQGYSIGASFGQGVAAGLYAMLGAVQAAASAIVAAAAQAAAAAGRISSPSRLMRDEIGVPLAQGVIVGMESQRRDIANTFASLLPANARTGMGFSPGIGASAYGGRGNPAPVQHVTIITLEPGRWQEVLRKADNGNRAYQQQQPRSREIALGTSR